MVYSQREDLHVHSVYCAYLSFLHILCTKRIKPIIGEQFSQDYTITLFPTKGSICWFPTIGIRRQRPLFCYMDSLPSLILFASLMESSQLSPPGQEEGVPVWRIQEWHTRLVNFLGARTMVDWDLSESHYKKNVVICIICIIYTIMQNMIWISAAVILLQHRHKGTIELFHSSISLGLELRMEFWKLSQEMAQKEEAVQEQYLVVTNGLLCRDQ